MENVECSDETKLTHTWASLKLHTKHKH